MKLAALQLNPIVGDLAGNRKRIASAVGQAAANGASLCLTTELAICGSPPRTYCCLKTSSQHAARKRSFWRVRLRNCAPFFWGAHL